MRKFDRKTPWFTVAVISSMLLYSATVYADSSSIRKENMKPVVPAAGARESGMIEPIGKTTAEPEQAPETGKIKLHTNLIEIDSTDQADAAPAIAETESKVTILFESNPANAELMINGLYVGSTPVQVPLRRGVYNVKLTASGHSFWERQVKAYKGLRVFATLEANAPATPQ